MSIEGGFKPFAHYDIHKTNCFKKLSKVFFKQRIAFVLLYLYILYVELCICEIIIKHNIQYNVIQFISHPQSLPFPIIFRILPMFLLDFNRFYIYQFILVSSPIPPFSVPCTGQTFKLEGQAKV